MTRVGGKVDPTGGYANASESAADDAPIECCAMTGSIGSTPVRPEPPRTP